MNELKDEIKAIRTDIQNLNIQQPQQSENNQELNSLLKETIVNAVNDTINAHINSRENYADEVSRRCKNTIDFAIERETKLVNNVLLPKLSPIIQIDKKIDSINARISGIENDIQKIPKDNIGSTNNNRFLYYCCPIKILQKTKNRADFICEVSPFSLDFRRQTNQSNYGQKYTF